MSLTLDLREAAEDAVRDRISETLVETDAVEILADRNVEPPLLAYQIDRNVELARDDEETGREVWELTVTHEGAVADEKHPAFDARHLPPQQRHSTLTAAFDDLDVSERYHLVNDHDPKPLYHQFGAEAGPEFRWEYQRKSSGEFRVLVGKAEGVDTEYVEVADGGTEAPF